MAGGSFSPARRGLPGSCPMTVREHRTQTVHQDLDNPARMGTREESRGQRVMEKPWVRRRRKTWEHERRDPYGWETPKSEA